ncbi:chitooligosaccharidolytic beta-N-acetylglucosaminidase-like [Photinus pyralis]|uniref:Beta-hexosaminidase n=1 Tax=Photinus pyralis TaxID=7054 RepID=A0A1Y1MF42_PHOPY|nr:chitooligosaccharidolytic beta-N-acetylglucosaminidase-like [Photinus pyralis]
MKCLVLLLIFLHLTKTQLFDFRSTDSVWTWTCKNNTCQKDRVQPAGKPLSLAACKILCDPYGGLWPKPTGRVEIGKRLIPIVKGKLDKNTKNKLVRAAYRNFWNNLQKLGKLGHLKENVSKLIVSVYITDPSQNQLKLSTDESYSLKISKLSSRDISANITAATYFGARHGFETLGQLIIYDDFENSLKIISDANITDGPAYPYRGVMLDTARNFISVETIKRTIDGLAASKLNTFHWHLTDSQSFPFVSKSNPSLSKLGAYSPKDVYAPKDVADIVEYALERGVRVLPEFDAPAHVGEGWQDTDFVACFNHQPWREKCAEPPCGQFDPTKPKLYDALEGLYKDISQQYNLDMFHMGGDEVSVACWNSTPSIVEWMGKQGWGRSEDDFIKLWSYFQSNALERFDRHSHEKLPIIMWTSALTSSKHVEQFLPKDRYIIQVWTSKTDPHVTHLLRKGYRMILSNSDALYLDCGYSGWVTGGNNWCSPYKGWQQIYDNSPALYGKTNQFLGGEAALWTEQVDDTAVDSRIWPRAAALAERLWAEPANSWRAAENRMLTHRERLVNRGIKADALEPRWCRQHENNCPL